MKTDNDELVSGRRPQDRTVNSSHGQLVTGKSQKTSNNDEYCTCTYWTIQWQTNSRSVNSWNIQLTKQLDKTHWKSTV